MSYQRILSLAADDVTAVLFPMYYISAMHAHVLPAMLVGARCVLVDGATPQSYVALLREHGVTWAYAVPSWWRLCLRVEDFRGLPTLSRLAAGGAPFPADLVAALRERVPTARLHDVYGLSRRTPPAASRPTTTCDCGRAAWAGRWTAWRRRCAPRTGRCWAPARRVSCGCAGRW
jgi:acyl-coenzyme A synthetase/AMP-(fatty) acid ligase